MMELSGCFIGNIFLLKLLRIFSSVLRSNPMLFTKDHFSTAFTPLFKQWEVE